jgi:hypothetical protein
VCRACAWQSAPGATEQVILRAAGVALDARRAEAGLPSEPGGAVRSVPTFSLSPPALEDPATPGPCGTLRFRPATAAGGTLPDLWPGDERPLVHLTLGTVAPSTDLFPAVYRTAIEALAALPVRVLVTVGREADPAALGPLPPAVRALSWVPQADVLAHAAAVASHGARERCSWRWRPASPWRCCRCSPTNPTTRSASARWAQACRSSPGSCVRVAAAGAQSGTVRATGDSSAGKPRPRRSTSRLLLRRSQLRVLPSPRTRGDR